MSSDPPLVAQVGLAAPRVAVIFNGGPAWPYWARLAIHTASQLWGGRGFLLIPHVDGVVDPVLLRAARTYDPDYVMRFPATVGQLERAEPGPLLIDGRLVEGEERAEALKDLAGEVAHEDPAGEKARNAVVKACSPYRRTDPSSYNIDLEQVVLANLEHTPSPLTPLSAIPRVAGSPFVTAPPTWGGPFGVIAAAHCGLFAEPETGEPPVIEEDDLEVLLRWLLFDTDQIDRVGVPEPLLKWMLSPDNRGNGGTAFQRTAYGLSQISEARGRRHHALFVVGETAADFAAAYATALSPTVTRSPTRPAPRSTSTTSGTCSPRLIRTAPATPSTRLRRTPRPMTRRRTHPPSRPATSCGTPPRARSPPSRP